MSVQYSSQKNFNHPSPQKIGILLVNLGTPDAPNTKSLKKYLKQFLSDTRVIELPRFFWFFHLKFYCFAFSFSKICPKISHYLDKRRLSIIGSIAKARLQTTKKAGSFLDCISRQMLC